jgi:hypothetical protein
MSIEDDPNKLREDDVQATPEWHRACAKALRKNGFAKMAEQHEQIAQTIERARQQQTNSAPTGETTEDAHREPREPIQAMRARGGTRKTPPCPAGFRMTPDWHQGRARFLSLARRARDPLLGPTRESGEADRAPSRS